MSLATTLPSSIYEVTNNDRQFKYKVRYDGTWIIWLIFIHLAFRTPQALLHYSRRAVARYLCCWSAQRAAHYQGTTSPEPQDSLFKLSHRRRGMSEPTYLYNPP